MRRQSLRAVLFATLLVLSAAVGGVGTVAADGDDGSGAQVQTCENPVTRAVGAVVGLTWSKSTSLTGSEANPCIRTEDIVDADTEAEAMRVIAQEALEDKRYFETYSTQFANHNDNLKNPAYSDARVTYVEELANGTDKVEAVTEARRAAHARTTVQQHELWTFYAAMADATGSLENLAEDKQVRNESMRIGYINSSGTFETGYTYQNDNTTVDITTTNGSTLSVLAPTKGNETIHPLNDDILVQVYDPESGSWEDVINTAEWESPPTVDSTGTYSLPSGVDSVTISFSGSQEVGVQPNGGSDITTWAPNGEDVVSTTSSGTNSWAGDYGDKITLRVTPDGLDLVRASDNTTVHTWTDITSLSSLKISKSAEGVSLSTSADLPLQSYTNEFASKHNELETIDNNVLDGLGTSDSGYLNDVHSAVSNGEINVSQMLTGYDKVRMTPDMYDTRAVQNWMYSQLGLGSTGPYVKNDSDGGTTASRTLVKIEAAAGATVDGSTIESSKTFDGASIWATSPPPGETWQTGETYSVSEFGDGAVIGVNYRTTETYQEDGTVKMRTTSESATISGGEFTVLEMQTEDGTVVQNVTHEDRNPATTNVSALNEQLEDLEEANERLRERLDNSTGGIGGGGAPGGGVTIGLPSVPFLGDLGSIGLPFDSLGVNIGALVMLAGGVVVVAFVGGPTTTILLFLKGRFDSLYRAATRIAGLTNATERGIEHPDGVTKRAKRTARRIRKK